LFADEYGDEHHDEVVRRHHELQISNGVFRSVFDDLLERYNFTIQEDSPTNYEVAIDPEMLGQIFEELILTSEESETAGKSKRHDTGSHYTRRPIVHYLCRDSLAAYLESQSPFLGKINAHERVRKLLTLDATEGIDEETNVALKAILTSDEAAVLIDRLFDLRACDPAVGSGAFPMGLLHELVNLARLCATRAAGKDPVLGDRSWLYNTKKRIIERVIYGVDIQPQAVDICKLRLWLSIMVDYELSADPDNCEALSFRKALKEIDPLPNLDFKIRRANSLVDYILILSGPNSYSGATLIQNGTVQFAKESSLYDDTVGDWTSANITVSNGAVLALNVGGTGQFTANDINALLNIGGSGTKGFQTGSVLALDTTNASGGNFTDSLTIGTSGTNSWGLGSRFRARLPAAIVQPLPPTWISAAARSPFRMRITTTPDRRSFPAGPR
jgi:autotransporter-associated beta strand protein